MSATIAILSQKGGPGKTTLTRSLADAFGRLGLDVLAVDADPQGNLSDYYDADPDAQPTLGEVLVGQARAADAVHGEIRTICERLVPLGPGGAAATSQR